MSSERRIQLMQAKRAEQLRQQAAALNPDGFAAWDELPAWVRTELDATRRSSAVPDATLPEKAPDPEVTAWMQQFVGPGGEWYVLTGIEQHPWLLVRPSGDAWLSDLVGVKGHELTLVRAGGGELVVFYAEEYEYQAFRRTRPAG